MKAHLRAACVIFLLMTVLTGGVYPALVAAVAQTVFPHQANGSIVMRGNSAIGSELIGQSFDDPRYFWGRPSATGPVPYNAAVSSGSNLGPTNPALMESVRARIEILRRAHPSQAGNVPVDLATSSASGLDPDISPAAAEYQVARVAQARNIPPDTIRQLVSAHTIGRTFGLLGEPRVHVLQLNLALDTITSK
ncbi:MAG: potassium-transporting ATPase subunit KdpC [Planctomycetes bacterium]|nr:potassium-transporting ATPase subunit KdpC [Planctomycetota bacterium]